MKEGGCPYNNLLTAGALPASSEFTFGFPMSAGLAASPCCMGAVVGAQLDLQLGSRKSVLIINLPQHQVGVISKPAESLAAGAGALPQHSRWGQAGLGERKSEHTEQNLSVALGPKELVPFKNRRQISS